MPHPVVLYKSTDTGAPTLNNAAGSMINVLDACLINGYNTKSVTSISVTDELATVTVSAHGFRNGQVVLVEGSTPSGLNGRQKVTVTGPNAVTYPAPGVPDGSASGTITMKAAPLGWTKQFSGTNKAVYARTAPEATAMLLRIDDTGAGVAAATYARAVMYESMSDVDTGVDPTPTTAGLSGGQYWSKGANNATAKRWMLIGDDRFFYFFTENFGASGDFASRNAYAQQGFGDVVPYRSSDAYHCVIGGHYNTIPQSNFLSVGNPLGSSPNSNNSSLIARQSNQIVKSVSFMPVPYSQFGTMIGGTGPSYPSPVDNGLVISTPVPCSEQNSTFNHPLRGHFPGYAVPLGNVSNLINEVEIGNVFGSDRTFINVALTSSAGPSSAVGSIFIDIDGPWR